MKSKYLGIRELESRPFELKIATVLHGTDLCQYIPMSIYKGVRLFSSFFLF